MTPQLAVAPRTALVDEPLDIRITGALSGQEVAVWAQLRDAQGLSWSSQATFAADDRGLVEVAAQPPLAGSYAGTDPMGLVWSMGPETAGERFASPGLDGVLTLTVEAGGQRLATVECERLLYAPGSIVRTPLRERGLGGTFCHPADGRAHPGILILGGSSGRVLESTAAILAAHGYAALALAYFGRDGLPPALVEIPLEYIGTALDWLGAHASVRGDRLAVLGRSKGGELALLAGASFPVVKAVVGYAASGVLWRGRDFAHAAWTSRGRPLPFVLTAPPADEATAGTPLFLEALRDTAAVEAATIPVERINGPVLLISGLEDRAWPAALLSEIAIARLARHRHPYPHTHLQYPGAGHIILYPYKPIAPEVLLSGGNTRDTAFAQADSWPRVLAFLKERLAD